MKVFFRLLLLMLVWASPAWAACDVQALTTVPLTITGGVVTVQLEVNGLPGTFILDTGAQRSVVTAAAVQRLHLARDQWVGTTMSGIGGIENRPNADPRSLSLGGVALARRTLNHDTSFTVGVLPRTQAGGLTIDGLLGRDFLSVFDLDLDFLGKQVTLYRVSGCSGRFLPWGGDYQALPVSMPVEDAVVVPVVVDGVKLRAMLDTGASSSLIAAPGMYRLGLYEPKLAGDPAHSVSGLGPRVVTMHQHAFRSLVVGGTTMDSPELWVAPVHLVPIVDMLLGADWLLSRRLWVSFATRQLFMAVP